MNTRSTERYPGFGCRRVCNMRSNCLSRFSRRRQKRLRARTMNLFLLPKPKRGILIADTKFEFGLDENGTLVWMDEAFTPDSSRFWPADQYQPSVRPPA